MNMFNYFKGKVSKIEADSPTRPSKNLSRSQQIYIEQINNYINIGSGYDLLKERLIKDINQNYMHQSPLIQQIVITLRKGLESRQKEKQRRSISIMEDLISNCGQIMNQAFNDSTFCDILYQSCLYLRNLKSQDRDQLREKACGVFLYWSQKFKSEPNYIYHRYYQKLRAEKGQFPAIPFIKQTKISNVILKQQAINVQCLIIDCEQIIQKTEKLLKENIGAIDTNYVRLLKAKTKKIFDLSSSNEVKLSEAEKAKLGQIYKKIRTQLKQIDKIHQNSIKEQRMEKQKIFLQEKMEGISPKKQEKLTAYQQAKVVQRTPKKQQKAALELIEGNQQILAVGKENNSVVGSPQKIIISHETKEAENINFATPKKSEKSLLDDEQSEEEVEQDQDQGGSWKKIPGSAEQIEEKNGIVGIVYSKLGQIQQNIRNVVNLKSKQSKQSKNSTQSKEQMIFQHDLLSMDICSSSKERNISQKQEQLIKPGSTTSLQEYEKQLRTPPKKTKKQFQQLFDFEGEKADQKAKTLNFKQLYSSSKLSPDLEGIDLSGSNKKLESKESLNSEQDEGFGDFS